MRLGDRDTSCWGGGGAELVFVGDGGGGGRESVTGGEGGGGVGEGRLGGGGVREGRMGGGGLGKGWMGEDPRRFKGSGSSSKLAMSCAVVADMSRSAGG